MDTTAQQNTEQPAPPREPKPWDSVCVGLGALGMSYGVNLIGKLPEIAKDVTLSFPNKIVSAVCLGGISAIITTYSAHTVWSALKRSPGLGPIERPELRPHETPRAQQI